MAKTVADQFAETLAAASVKRVYGIVGDILNGLTDAFCGQGKIEWVHVRHEEVAAIAAAAEAHLTAQLAVCARSVDQAIYTSSMASSIVTDRACPVCLRLGGADRRSNGRPVLASPCTGDRAVDDANRGLERGR